MKVRIKSVPEGWECDYLTKGKEYESSKNEFVGDGGLELLDDVGDAIFINIHRSAHLDGGSWEIIEDARHY